MGRRVAPLFRSDDAAPKALRHRVRCLRIRDGAPRPPLFWTGRFSFVRSRARRRVCASVAAEEVFGLSTTTVDRPGDDAHARVKNEGTLDRAGDDEPELESTHPSIVDSMRHAIDNRTRRYLARSTRSNAADTQLARVTRVTAQQRKHGGNIFLDTAHRTPGQLLSQQGWGDIRGTNLPP
jgi:hypothetical protein